MKHLALFFIAILSLSQSANIVRAAAAPALMIGFWRLLGSGLFMLSLRFWKIRKDETPFWEPVPSSTWTWTALSGSFFFLHLWTFFYAAQNTTIANCMVIFETNPIFTALGAWILLKDKFEKRYALAFLLAFIGVGILFSDRLDWDTARSGDFSALLSAFFFSIYIVTGKKARLKMSTDQFTWLIYSWTAVLFLVVGLHQGVQWVGYPAFTWWAIFANIVFPTLLGHTLITHLLKYFNINWLSCGKLMEPAFSALVAFLAFGETLKSGTLISFAFTVAAVFVLFWPLLFTQNKRPETVL